MFSLRSIRSRLPNHARYLDPFPEDVEASFADLLDALDSEQQHEKVAALSALFRKGLARSTSVLEQADYGHRVLLFLMKMRGRVLESRVDDAFMREFMRAVGSKKRKEAELEKENERVRRLLAEEDEASEDGRWWRQEVNFSSGDELSDWSDSDDDLTVDEDEDDGWVDDGVDGEDAEEQTGAQASDSARMPFSGEEEANKGDWELKNGAEPFRNQQHRTPLPLLRERSALLFSADVQRLVHHGRGNPYSDPRSLAVWMAVKSNPGSTHLSKCLNPRLCLSKESFIEQMLNAVMGFDRPGQAISVDVTYNIVEGVHLEGISVGATRTVAQEVLIVANALRRSEQGLLDLPQTMASAFAREIRVCRHHCLQERPQSLADLVRTCSAVRHRAILLDTLTRIEAETSSNDSTGQPKSMPSTAGKIKALVDELELECSSGAMAISMGVLLELLVASEDVQDALRTDFRRLCREYMAVSVVSGGEPQESTTCIGPAPLVQSPVEVRKMQWWEEEFDDMAIESPLSRFVVSPVAREMRPRATADVPVPEEADKSDELHAAPQLDALDNPSTVDPMRHYQMMEESSRNSLHRYWDGCPFVEYDSLAAVRACVLGKIDDLFGKATPPQPTTPTPHYTASAVKSSRDAKESYARRASLPIIYPLPPSFQLTAMSKASAPRLVPSQLGPLAGQIAAVKRVCFMQFPFDTMDDELRAHVESMWTTEDCGRMIHHVAFHPPLSDLLGPEARLDLSVARGAVVSLQTAWKTAVDVRRESLKGKRSMGAPSSSSRAQHLGELAMIACLREAYRTIEMAFWDFERNVSSVMYVGNDTSHLGEVIRLCFVQLRREIESVKF